MKRIFEDRKQAGRLLASELNLLSLKDRENTFILALPRGGVPVAHEVSQALGIKYDVLIVRKIGHPLQPEYGIGALSEEGFFWMDPDALGLSEVSASDVNYNIEKEKMEIRRRVEVYRQGRSLPRFHNKTIIIIDDGLATGVTARVAAKFAKNKGAKKVILAVPVCSERTIDKLRYDIDEIVSLNEPSLFFAVGQFYESFTQVTDQEVVSLLEQHESTDVVIENFEDDEEESVVNDLLTNDGLNRLELAEQSIDNVIEKHAVPLRSRFDLQALIKKMSQAKIVMLGESTHGTQDFYEWRRLISQELITKHGFNFIAVEGDWPACAQFNKFIHQKNGAANPAEALEGFQRWPTWMWANTETLKLAQWLKKYNQNNEQKASVFGLDVYSLFESIDEVLKILKKTDPVLARKMQVQYECFEPFHRNEKEYVKHLAYVPEGCENQVLSALRDLLKVRLNKIEKEPLFDILQNARIIKNAESYYRAMIQGNEDSWNVRDRHMLETLEGLLNRFGPNSKIIVWAHNTHVGDYRATDMVDDGQINLGGLSRDKWGQENVCLIGFGTYQGEVIAARSWGGPTEVMQIPAGRPDSYEAQFHVASRRLEQNSFYLWLQDELKTSELSQTLGHRAIGVVYHPDYERFGNYVPTSLSRRYDGFIFINKTKALTPISQKFNLNELPETWPQGM